VKRGLLATMSPSLAGFGRGKWDITQMVTKTVDFRSETNALLIEEQALKRKLM
jgi:hypothetical protein